MLGQDGVYNANTSALSMGPGWIEFEFQPWPEFQNLAVSELALIMERATVFNTEQLPVLELWDWQEAAWIGIRDVQWGSIPVPDGQRFVGPANAVRIRVENNWNTSLEIGTIYPQMTGDVN